MPDLAGLSRAQLRARPREVFAARPDAQEGFEGLRAGCDAIGSNRVDCGPELTATPIGVISEVTRVLLASSGS